MSRSSISRWPKRIVASSSISRSRSRLVFAGSLAAGAGSDFAGSFDAAARPPSRQPGVSVRAASRTSCRATMTTGFLPAGVVIRTAACGGRFPRSGTRCVECDRHGRAPLGRQIDCDLPCNLAEDFGGGIAIVDGELARRRRELRPSAIAPGVSRPARKRNRPARPAAI